MGPGYFPIVLGGILILFGIYVMLRGLRKNEKIQGNWSLRALIVLPLSMVVFGILMDLAGFVPALAALVFISAAIGKGISACRGPAADPLSGHAFGGHVHLGPRPALPPDQGILTRRVSWNCSII